MIARLYGIATVIACVLSASSSFAQDQNHHYGLRYDLSLIPAEDRADVAITLDERAKGKIWSLRFRVDPERHKSLNGDGSLQVDGDHVTWNPPEAGGRLTFQVSVSNRRGNGAFDARMTEDWAIFRGDDLFPAAHTQEREDSEADTTLHVKLPDGWSLATPYQEIADETYEVDHAHRRFERPIGWMAAGRLGVRRERIAGVRGLWQVHTIRACAAST